MPRPLLIAFLVLGVIPVEGRAQRAEPLPAFLPVEAAELRRGVVLFDLARGADGFLWVATREGLVRYDGQGTRTFSNRPDDPTSIPDDLVRVVVPDGDALWLGTFGGLARFDPATGRSGRVLTTAADGSPLRVYSVHLDGRSVWAAAHDGLYRYTPDTGRVRRFAHDPGDPATLPNAPATTIAPAPGGDLWVGTLAGLVRLDPSTGRAERLALGVGPVFAVQPAPGGALWLGTGEGVAHYDPATADLTRVPAGDGGPSLTLDVSPTGDVWAGNASGLFRVTPSGAVAPVFLNRERQQAGSSPVRAVVADGDGAVWAARHDGLFRAPTTPFSTFHAAPPDDETLVSVWDIERVGTDDYVATGSGLFRLVAATGRAVRVAPGIEAASDVLWHEGRLWVGSSGAVASVDLASGATRTFRLPVSTDLNVLAPHPGGGVWAGTDDGLFRVGSDGSVEPAAAELPSPRVYALAPSHDGLWVGTFAGLGRLSAGGGAVEVWTAAKDGLPSDRVYALDLDRAGVWAATDRGLAFLDRDLRVRQVVTVADGLPTSVTVGVTRDADGRVWATSSRGLAVFDPERPSASMRVLTAEDGLLGGRLLSSPRRLGRGALAVVGEGGVSAFHPRDVLSPPALLAVAVVGASLFGDPIPLPARGLEFGPGDHSFGLTFAALDPVLPGRALYSYRLPGYTDWTPASDDRPAASFTHVPPGAYDFEVRARLPGGAWGPVATVPVRLPAPWWRTVWAYAAYALLAVGLVVGGAQARVRSARARADAVLRERTRIAQELHDTLLQGFSAVSLQAQIASDLVESDPEAARATLALALSQADYALAEATAAIQEQRSPSVQGQSLGDAVSQAARTALLAAPPDARPELELDVEGGVALLTPSAETDVLRVVTEAVANVARHAAARTVRVEIRQRPGILDLLIQDDGRGFDPDHVPVREGAGRPRWGLVGIRERAERLGASLDIQSVRGEGTTVRLRVPTPS